MVREITYVTGNPGKFNEVSTFINDYGSNIILKQQDLDLDEIQSLDQKKVALHKAQQAWNMLKKPLLVDDSGIYFDQYYKFPGTFTRYLFECIGLDGILRLVQQGDPATFFLFLVYVDERGLSHVFQGECKGTIIFPPEQIAPKGFPYDDLFLPVGSEKTYAELRKEDPKSLYFCRLRALKKFLEWFQEKMALKVS